MNEIGVIDIKTDKIIEIFVTDDFDIENNIVNGIYFNPDEYRLIIIVKQSEEETEETNEDEEASEEE